MAAIFDLDAILEFQPYWYSDILKKPPSWNCFDCLNCVDDDLPWLIESCFIGLFRFTVKLSWLWLKVVIDLWLFWISLCMGPLVQWSPIFGFNRALGKMVCNCRDIVVYWILGNSGMECLVDFRYSWCHVYFRCRTGTWKSCVWICMALSSTPRYAVFGILSNCMFLCQYIFDNYRVNYHEWI